VTETVVEAPPVGTHSFDPPSRARPRGAPRQTTLGETVEPSNEVSNTASADRDQSSGWEGGEGGRAFPTGSGALPQTSVSLRPLKAVAETFGPTHPLRTLLLSEPDEVPAAEYALKVGSWFRLLRTHRT
jgi:hypothetical protein